MTIYGDISTYNHLVIVADDAKKTVQNWADTFAFEAPQLIDTGPVFSKWDFTKYASICNGRNWKAAFKQAVFQQPKDFFEIDEPGPDDYFEEYRNAHGNGVCYFGILAGENRDALVNRLINEYGLSVKVEQSFPGGDWTVINTEKLLGSDICIKKHVCVENKDHISLNDFTAMFISVDDLDEKVRNWKDIFNADIAVEGRTALIKNGPFPIYLLEEDKNGIWAISCDINDYHDLTKYNVIKEITCFSKRYTFFDTKEALGTIMGASYE